MRDYKDETIEKLCAVLNILDDCGCLLSEEKDEYRAIISEYITAQTETKDNRFGPHSHDGTFLNRYDAMDEAIKCNQLPPFAKNECAELYSEDLW